MFVSGVLGLMWGWAAFATGSILWTTISQVLFDFSGLGGRVYFMGVGDDSGPEAGTVSRR